MLSDHVSHRQGHHLQLMLPSSLFPFAQFNTLPLTQVNFQIYRSRARGVMPEKRIVQAGFEAENVCKGASPEKSAWQSSAADDDDDVIAKEVADAKEEDHGEETGDVEEAEMVDEQLSKSHHPEPTRPLPFVDETADEEEEGEGED